MHAGRISPAFGVIEDGDMQENHREGFRTTGPADWSFRAPLLLAATLICAINGVNIARLVAARSPHDPWEASEVLEAWRSSRGMPVYDGSPDRHATHFYGALVPWVQGEIFRWVGPNNVSGRALTLISALATIALIMACTRTKGSVFSLVIIGAALFGINHRGAQYFSENRPDMTSLFFTTAALALMGLGLERRRPAAAASGTACLIIAFFFKQTALAFAIVPVLVLALRARRPTRSEILMAVAPLAASVLVVFGLKVFRPAVYHFVIEIPGTYRVDWRHAVRRVWEVLLLSPLFLVLAGEWLVVDGGGWRKDSRMRWLIAILAVALPSSAVAYAKHGGAANCMLPALFAMLTFCALRLPGIIGRMEGGSASSSVRTVRGIFAAALLLMTIFPTWGFWEHPPAWDEDYETVIAAAARLPGAVVCPEDPTIPLYAKKYAGRGLFPEMDARPESGAWPRAMPDIVANEIRAADFVVDLRDYRDDQRLFFLQPYLDEPVLRGLGFVPADDVLPGSPAYRIWRRGAPVTAP
jgi:hypothetical protein